MKNKVSLIVLIVLLVGVGIFISYQSLAKEAASVSENEQTSEKGDASQSEDEREKETDEDSANEIDSELADKIENAKVEIPVLMYHHFSKTDSSNSTIHPDEFRQQMEHLKDKGYEPIVSEDLISMLNGQMDIPKNPIMITIDDGYESNYHYAFPILKELEMRATVFVIGKVIRESDDTPQAPNEIPKLSWDQAIEMYDSGFIDIQNHSYNMHQKAPTDNGEKALISEPIMNHGKLETKKEYESRVMEDLSYNKRLIEAHIGNKVLAFAYPFGEYSESSETLLKETGHELSFTVKPGFNWLRDEDDIYLLNRINVPPEISGEQLIEMISEYN